MACFDSKVALQKWRVILVAATVVSLPQIFVNNFKINESQNSQLFNFGCIRVHDIISDHHTIREAHVALRRWVRSEHGMKKSAGVPAGIFSDQPSHKHSHQTFT